MATYVLTLFDVRQVQRYLFNANELKQNLGASYLVEQVTRAWLHGALPARHNWPDAQKDAFEPAMTIESGSVDAEVVFTGGGNAAILFTTEQGSREFSKKYSHTLLEQAPGLDVAIGHINVDWDQKDGLLKAWKRLQEDIMMRRKEGLGRPQALAGLGITAECAFTGKPAIDELEEGVLVSAEALAKRQSVAKANQRLRELLEVKEYAYPLQMDDFGGERGHARYIAVVHADGNGMGKRVESYLAKASDNRDAVRRMREFSASVNQAGIKSMEAVLDHLLNAIVKDEKSKLQISDSWDKKQVVTLHNSYLPIRPIVFGGDDVSFICEGRLGLHLAALLLKAFSKQILIDDDPVYACAGVAIVHTHYPFARAYALAEDLCAHAKKEARDLDGMKPRLSLLHWYYAAAGRTRQDWDEIRSEEYLLDRGAGGKDNLTLRPLVVTAGSGVSPDRWRTWDVFLTQIQEFRSAKWIGRRNKIKDLRAALRQGRPAVVEFTALYGNLPDLQMDGLEDAQKNGWYNSRCVYFDALEANDLFIYPKEASHE